MRADRDLIPCLCISVLPYGGIVLQYELSCPTLQDGDTTLTSRPLPSQTVIRRQLSTNRDSLEVVAIPDSNIMLQNLQSILARDISFIGSKSLRGQLEPTDAKILKEYVLLVLQISKHEILLEDRAKFDNMSTDDLLEKARELGLIAQEKV